MRKSLLALLTVLTAVPALVAVPAQAQGPAKTPLTPELLWQLGRVGSVQLSPDKKNHPLLGYHLRPGR